MGLEKRVKFKNFFRKIFLLSLLTLSVVDAADMDSSYNAGINAADQTKGVLTSGQKDRLYAPLTSDTLMTTLDGSKSGRVRLWCKDATNFRLEFYFIPKGNNTYRLMVKKGDGTLLLDTDNITYRDGFLDNSITHKGIAISGVCENGVVYCKDGVWDNQHCYYFKYVADSSGNLSLSQAWLNHSSSADLGQCNCTDASCGWNNIVPYSYVVGGIAKALMSANPKYQMSSGNWDSSQLKYTYYGMDNSNCTSASENPFSPGDDNPSRFYSPGGGDISRGAVDSVVARQSSNENSPYSIATKLQDVEYTKDGKVIRVAKPDSPYCFVSNDIGIQQETVDPVLTTCKIKSARIRYYRGGCGFSMRCNVNGTSCGGVLNGCDGDGQVASVSINGLNFRWYAHWYGDKRLRPTSGSMKLTQCGDISRYICGADWCATLYASTEPVYGCPPGYTMVGNSCKKDKAVLVSNDGCAPYKSRSECHVYNKWICKRGETNQQNCIRNGFQTVRNSAEISDGGSYPVQCYDTSTDVASYRICELPTSALSYRTMQVLVSGGSTSLSYSSNSPTSSAAAGNGSFSALDGRFTTLYQYQCLTDTGVDIERSKGVMASLSMSGNTAAFRDPAYPEKGTQILTTPKFSSCLDTFCLVKTTGRTTEVNPDSTNKAQTQGGITVLYDKRKCKRTTDLKYNDDTTPSFTCPVETGETILANCDCEENIDALTKHTISVLEAAEQMTKDWICSSN